MAGILRGRATRRGVWQAVAAFSLAAPALWRPGRAQAATADDDRPWRNLFYGNPSHGDTPQPAQIKHGRPVALVTEAERPGRIVGVRLQLRAFNKGFRPRGSPGDYSQGDGGRIRIQLRTVGDGGLPTETVLGQTQANNGWSEPLCVDGVRNFEDYAFWAFDEAVPVTTGMRIALHFENVREDVSAAGDWVSTNFLRMAAPEPFGSGLSAGPYLGDRHAQYRWVRDRWAWHPPNQGFFEFSYEDGHATGLPYIWSGSEVEKAIGGGAALRQRFELTDYDRRVDALWLRLFWDGEPPSPLRVEVAPLGDRPLLSLEVSARRISRTANRLGDVGESPPARWIRLPLEQPLELVRGAIYACTLTAADGSYRTRAVRRASPRHQHARSRNLWANAWSEESADGGVTWDGLTRADEPERARRDCDLPLAFAVARGG